VFKATKIAGSVSISEEMFYYFLEAAIDEALPRSSFEAAIDEACPEAA